MELGDVKGEECIVMFSNKGQAGAEVASSFRKGQEDPGYHARSPVALPAWAPLPFSLSSLI